MWCVPFISKRWHLFIRSQIIFVEARTHFDVLLLELKLKAIQYKSSSLSYHENALRENAFFSHSISSSSLPPLSLYLAHCIRILFLLSLLLCFISFYFIFYSCIYLSQTVVLCCRYIHLPVRILFYFILYCTMYSTHFCTLYFLDTHVYLFICWNGIAISGSEYSHTLIHQRMETIRNQSNHDLWTNGKWQIEKVFFFRHDTNIYIYLYSYYMVRKKFTTFKQCIISFQNKNSIFWNLQKIGMRSTMEGFQGFSLGVIFILSNDSSLLQPPQFFW